MIAPRAHDPTEIEIMISSTISELLDLLELDISGDPDYHTIL
jgi:hypothetical protein